MADLTVEVGTQLSFEGTGLSPADAGTDMRIGTPTVVALTLSALADGAGRQSAKFDFGANRARKFSVDAAFDFTGETPTAGERVDIYFLPSHNSVAAEGNVAGNSGADAAAPDGALGSITLAEFADQGVFIDSFIVHDGASVQCGHVGVLEPPSRYGQLLVINESGDAFEADNVESHVVLTPILDDVATS